MNQKLESAVVLPTIPEGFHIFPEALGKPDVVQTFEHVMTVPLVRDSDDTNQNHFYSLDGESLGCLRNERDCGVFKWHPDSGVTLTPDQEDELYRIFKVRRIQQFQEVKFMVMLGYDIPESELAELEAACHAESLADMM